MEQNLTLAGLLEDLRVPRAREGESTSLGAVLPWSSPRLFLVVRGRRGKHWKLEGVLKDLQCLGREEDQDTRRGRTIGRSKPKT